MDGPLEVRDLVNSTVFYFFKIIYGQRLWALDLTYSSLDLCNPLDGFGKGFVMTFALHQTVVAIPYRI